MKKYFCALVILLATLGLGRVSHADPPISPFPLDYPVKFPWTSIEGVWQVTNSDAHWEFSFEVQSDCSGRQILKVFQVDPVSGAIVAEGIGYKNDATLEVYAAMTSAGDGMVPNYVLHIGAYRDTHSAGNKHVVVLKVMPFTGGSAELDYRISKEPGRLPIEIDGEMPAACAP